MAFPEPNGGRVDDGCSVCLAGNGSGSVVRGAPSTTHCESGRERGPPFSPDSCLGTTLCHDQTFRKSVSAPPDRFCENACRARPLLDISFAKEGKGLAVSVGKSEKRGRGWGNDQRARGPTA